MFLRIITIISVSVLLFSGCKTIDKVFKSKGNTSTDQVVSANNKEGNSQNTSKKIKIPENATPEVVVSVYIQNYSDIAQEEMQEYGIPASISLAQGILESGVGMGELFLKSNNHFGIKCHNSWKGDVVYHDDDEILECFRKYEDPDDSYRDHSLFLSTRAQYIELFDLKEDDYKGWAKGLQRAGYATDVNYPEKLINIIEKHELYRFDDEVLGRKSKRSKKKDKRSGTVGTYIVQKGDTLWAISSDFNMTIKSIKELNRLNTDTIYVGQVLKIYK